MHIVFCTLIKPQNSIAQTIIHTHTQIVSLAWPKVLEGSAKPYDGINLAKMSNDRSLAGYRIPEWKKKFMRRNWEKLANFTKDNNIILVLRDIIFKNPKDTEKKINFLELLKNKVLWLSSDNRMIDDLVVIIISNIMSILLNKEYLYVSNDNFSDHLNFINRISNINTRINPKILSYCPIRGYYF